MSELALAKLTFFFLFVFVFCRQFHLADEGEMLAAYLNQIAHLSVWFFDAGAAISDVDENAFGGFVIFALD